MALPTALYSAAQVRALDAYEIEQRRVPGYTLMTRAGEAALRYLRTRWPQAQRIVMVCGAGNNGGDGYVLARLAQAAGLDVLVLAAGAAGQAHGRCARAYGGLLRQRRAARIPSPPTRSAASDVIVDALFGTGLRGGGARRGARGDPRHQRTAAARCWRWTFPPGSMPTAARCSGTRRCAPRPP